jgi:hypothetical protein
MSKTTEEPDSFRPLSPNIGGGVARMLNSTWIGLTALSLLVYTRRSNVHGSSSSGRNVTEAVIWRIMAEISCVISFSGLSGPSLGAYTRQLLSST